MSSRSVNTQTAHGAGPAAIFRPVTPDDAAPLPYGVAKALFVGEAGDLVVEDAQGNVATIVSGAAQYHPLRIAKVHASGTSASGIVALY